MIANRISNLLIVLVFLALSAILIILGIGLIDTFELPKWLLAIWGMLGGIYSFDVACKIGFVNYKSIFTFVNTLEIKHKVAFWGAIFTGSVPMAVYFQFPELFKDSAFSFLVPLLTIALTYLPIRLLGSSKLKERILEKRI